MPSLIDRTVCCSIMGDTRCGAYATHEVRAPHVTEWLPEWQPLCGYCMELTALERKAGNYEDRLIELNG